MASNNRFALLDMNDDETEVAEVKQNAAPAKKTADAVAAPKRVPVGAPPTSFSVERREEGAGADKRPRLDKHTKRGDAAATRGRTKDHHETGKAFAHQSSRSGEHKASAGGRHNFGTAPTREFEHSSAAGVADEGADVAAAESAAAGEDGADGGSGEPAVKTMTLEQYEASLASKKAAPALPLRAANEGVDESQWAGLKPVPKKQSAQAIQIVKGGDQGGRFVGRAGDITASLNFRVARDHDGGDGPSSPRGGRGGRGGFRGGRGGDRDRAPRGDRPPREDREDRPPRGDRPPREDRPPRGDRDDRAPRGDSRGRGRGDSRGAGRGAGRGGAGRGGAPRPAGGAPSSGRSAPDIHDASAFPALGAA